MIPKKVKKTFFIYFTVVLGLAIVLILVEKTGSFLTPTEVVKYGDLKVSENVEGILIFLIFLFVFKVFQLLNFIFFF